MDAHPLPCNDTSSCILCSIREPNLDKRQSLLAAYFKHLPSQVNVSHAFAPSGLRSFAMSQPNNADLVDAGIFGCMASLIWKGIHDRRWLLQQQNIYIPYYAGHIIGSYTMNREDFSERAVQEGVIPPLIELLRGRLTWVEQRVAVRALGHLASFNSTFLSVAVHSEILELAMELATCALDIVYTHFVQFEDKRLRYHRDLLTRRATKSRGRDMESWKAEEWASQLQCWSLQLINCFAFKEKYIPTTCKPGFLVKLPDMWGGLVNEESPAGVGLLRTVCHHKLGRSSVATLPTVVQALCRISQTSDDWQYMAIECLLLLTQDTQTRQQVMDMVAVAMVDLAELPIITSAASKRSLGEEIIETLLQDDTQSPSAFLRASLSERTTTSLDELASQCLRSKWEKRLTKQEHLAKEHLALNLKIDGNTSFAAQDVVMAYAKYTEALALCPIRAKKERMVLYSNRAQCHLLMHDAEAAISDTTRALCLARPVNCHGKSLWRRAQAYEMLGLAKESLLDAIMFAHECTRSVETGMSLLNLPAVPDYVDDLVRQQMKETWLFKEPAMKHGWTGYPPAAVPNSRSGVTTDQVEAPAAGAHPISPSSVPSTGTRVTMARPPGEPELEASSGSDSEWPSSTEEASIAAEAVQQATLDHRSQHYQSRNKHRSQQEQHAGGPYHHHQQDYEAQSRFTPRSRNFLYSLHSAAMVESSPIRKPVSPKRAPSPLLPAIREEIDKHLEQAGHGCPLDAQLLKKTVFDLLHQNFLLDRSRSSTAVEDHFSARDNSSYIAR